jgi:putative ABC transport system substrate-binding protein
MLETGVTVFLGIALILWKLPRRLMLKILHHDLMLDLAVSVLTLFLHWGSFEGVMAATVNVNILPIEAQDLIGIENGFERMRREHAGAVIVLVDSFFNNQRRPIAELVSKNRMPSMFAWKEDVRAGGLMSYGPNLLDSYRLAAVYVDKILKGAKPGNLPIEQPTKFDLVVNLKTAKALGIKIPQAVLLSATEVIE